jgi:sec-independent protein translocase protein TatC
VADLEVVQSTGLTVQATDPHPDEPEEDQAVMGLVEHLSELRRRMAVCVLAVVIGSVLGFLLAPTAINILKQPVPGPLRFTELGGAFFIQVKVAVVIGAALGMPILLYEFWAFIAPGLTREERRIARPWVPLAAVFFFIGCAVAYAILPFVSAFLLAFSIPGVLDPLITAEAYFGFITTMFIAFGLVMEFPIILVLLSKVGIITSKRLASTRRIVLLGIFIFAVVVTPGGDPISPAILGSVMYVLYELTIRLVRWTGK